MSLSKTVSTGFLSFCVLLTGCTETVTHEDIKPFNDLPRFASLTESPRPENGFASDDALKTYLETHGPRLTMAMAEDIAPTVRECHNIAHRVGRFSLEIFGNDVFRLMIPACQSGFVHGAIEGFLKKHGTENLSQNLHDICTFTENPFLAHQCYHGVGHGLTAWLDYDVPAAIDYCDMMPAPANQRSCQTGVFMENIQGFFSSAQGGEHVSEYLSDDPEYPCNIMPEHAKRACYFSQTDRMLMLSRDGMRGVVAFCERVPEEYRELCFESMGRTAMAAENQDFAAVIADCQVTADMALSRACIRGAAQDTFWDASGSGAALSFCRQVPTRQQEDCYGMLGARASHVLAGEALVAFCDNLPHPLHKECVQGPKTRGRHPILSILLWPQPTEQKTVPSAPALPAATGALIRMTGEGFSPRRARVFLGSEVCWQNDDDAARWPASNVHPTHELYSAFDPLGGVPPGDTWCFAFDKPGYWRFHDHLLPQFSGGIEVIRR